MSCFRNPGIYLVGSQLTTLARLGTLCHLDLQIVGVGEIHAGYAKASRGNLLDCTASLRIE